MLDPSFIFAPPPDSMREFIPVKRHERGLIGNAERVTVIPTPKADARKQLVERQEQRLRSALVSKDWQRVETLARSLAALAAGRELDL